MTHVRRTTYVVRSRALRNVGDLTWASSDQASPSVLAQDGQWAREPGRNSEKGAEPNEPRLLGTNRTAEDDASLPTTQAQTKIASVAGSANYGDGAVWDAV